MKTVFKSDNGEIYDTVDECQAADATWAENISKRKSADRSMRVSEDFKFMVLCASKGNMEMYHLLKDRELV